MDDQESYNDAPSQDASTDEQPATARRNFMRIAAGAAAGGAAVALGTASPAHANTPVDGGTVAAPGDPIQVRRGSATEWTTANPAVTLDDGEIGFERDTGRIKVGDSTHTWPALPYVDDVSHALATVAHTAVSDHLNESVTLAGIDDATTIQADERLLAYQSGSPGTDVMIPIADIASFARSDVAYSLTGTADVPVGVTAVGCSSSSDVQLRLPEFTIQTFSEDADRFYTRKIRVIQANTGRVEFVPVLSGGVPNTNVSFISWALTDAANNTVPPATAPTRIRTKGKGAVAIVEEAVVYSGYSIWLVSGDVEAFA